MIPPPLFSAVLFQSVKYKTAEFLSEIKERLSLRRRALLKEVVG